MGSEVRNKGRVMDPSIVSNMYMWIPEQVKVGVEVRDNIETAVMWGVGDLAAFMLLGTKFLTVLVRGVVGFRRLV